MCSKKIYLGFRVKRGMYTFKFYHDVCLLTFYTIPGGLCQHTETCRGDNRVVHYNISRTDRQILFLMRAQRVEHAYYTRSRSFVRRCTSAKTSLTFSRVRPVWRGHPLKRVCDSRPTVNELTFSRTGKNKIKLVAEKTK